MAITIASALTGRVPGVRSDRWRALKAAALVLSALALLAARGGSALAVDADRVVGTVSVEPSTIAAGGNLVVTASGLEPMSDRVIVLLGQDLTVELGNVTADPAGAFQAEFAIPLHLPAGTYELRAIGDLILATQVTVTSGVAGARAGQSDDGASMVATTLILLATAAVMLAAAGVVAWRFERIQRHLRVRSS